MKHAGSRTKRALPWLAAAAALALLAGAPAQAQVPDADDDLGLDKGKWVHQFALATADGTFGSGGELVEGTINVNLFPLGRSEQNTLAQWDWSASVRGACGGTDYPNASSGSDPGPSIGDGQATMSVDPQDTTAEAAIAGEAYSTSCRQNIPYILEVTMETHADWEFTFDDRCSFAGYVRPTCVQTSRENMNGGIVDAKFMWCLTQACLLGADDGIITEYNRPFQVRIGKDIVFTGGTP